MTSSSPPPPGAETVLGKVMAVLDAFGIDDHELRLAEISRRTGLAKGTLHRVLSDLVAARLVERADEGYRLGGRLFELGMRASVERRLIEVATPFLEDLYERTHETVHLGVLEGNDVVYVLKIGGHRQAAAPSRIGGRMPWHVTAIGKALMAHEEGPTIDAALAVPLVRLTPRTVTAPGLLRRQLERVVETGAAFENEESAVGIVCAATAVLDAFDRPVAAISITGPVTRFRPDTQVAALRAVGAGLATTLARRAELIGWTD